ncbi:fibronectin type 3 and ankyrin repeat domains protein 1 [Suncus etruscus]|uniref:fibronectin type 3 and ankyrin repeat domains protein 1 n=1 Tax=Suncus etruscus TaxID=109475 RepID=UPI00210F3646|nr:fibronectin type 3 and ankyrin repeat domains protein 1 [Suncus etruscus]
MASYGALPACLPGPEPANPRKGGAGAVVTTQSDVEQEMSLLEAIGADAELSTKVNTPDSSHQSVECLHLDKLPGCRSEATVAPCLEITPSSKPHPPVVGKVTHHSIELYWDLDKKGKRQGPQDQWLRFSIEEEDPKTHTYGIIYTGYSTQHVVEGLEPRTVYRFRLRVTSPSGDCEYSPVVSVSTTREPLSSEHFHRAVSLNDEELLVRMLQGGNIQVDVPNKFGFTALMVAAQKGYTSLVKILLSNGTDVNLKNGSGKDSLMLACYAGHLDVVKCLRMSGASWQSRDLGGCTALHWAADGGHCHVIEWMIKDGCEVDSVDAGSGWTPLMRVSAVSGNQAVASLLIDAGADVNKRDKDGKTPLMVAVLNNHEELVQLLLDRGADASVKNEFGKGVLDMARVFDRQNVVSLLEERKKQMPKKPPTCHPEKQGPTKA